MEPFRFGLVGAGRMGRTHLRAFEGSEHVKVVAVADLVESNRRAVATDYGLTEFAELDQMLASGLIDGVLVASSTATHIPIVEVVSSAGLPVLCEKPFGTSAQEARRALGLATASGVAVQVAYWRRFVPVLQELKQRIDGGGFGGVLSLVCSQWDGEPPSPEFRSGSGGVFIDMGVHEIDQARWLLGSELRPVSVVAGHDPSPTDPDGAVLVAESSSAVPVVITLGRYYPGGDMVRVEVFGTADHLLDEFLTPTDGEAVQLLALERQAAAFAEYARGGPCTGATIEDAVAALEVAAWAQSQLGADGSAESAGG